MLMSKENYKAVWLKSFYRETLKIFQEVKDGEMLFIFSDWWSAAMMVDLLERGQLWNLRTSASPQTSQRWEMKESSYVTS